MQPKNSCPKCGTNITSESSVQREYHDKDGGDSVFALGHYLNNGEFEPDEFEGFG